MRPKKYAPPRARLDSSTAGAPACSRRSARERAGPKLEAVGWLAQHVFRGWVTGISEGRCFRACRASGDLVL